MFEKEAKEYLDTESKYLIEDNEGNIINIAKKVKQAFQDGVKFGYNKAKEDADKMKSQFLELCNLKDMRIAELEKANEWHYVKEGCKYPENGESVLVTVLDDDNEKIVTMALFELENNKRFWDIESRLCSIHSGSEEVCSKIIAWAKVLPAGGEK